MILIDNYKEWWASLNYPQKMIVSRQFFMEKDADLISDDDIKFAHKRYKEIDAEIESNRKKFPNYFNRRRF